MASWPLPGTLVALWVYVEAEHVATHWRWQDSTEHIICEQISLCGLIQPVLEGQQQSKLVQEDTQAVLESMAIALDQLVVSLGRQVAH